MDDALTTPPRELVRLRSADDVQIRPVAPEDADALLRALTDLSPESGYRRFLGPKREMTRREIDYLTVVDHHQHEALVAFEPGTDHGLGVARFVKDRRAPEAAEVAITVADEWQGRGLGGALLDRLAVRAVEEGVTCFTALVLASNDRAIALLRRLGPVQTRRAGPGATEVLVPLATGPAQAR